MFESSATGAFQPKGESHQLKLPMPIRELPTPCLLLDRRRLRAKIARMQARAKHLGVHLRPHLKTAKSAEVGRLALSGTSDAITVSTVAEAEYFARRGICNIFSAVGILPQRVARLAALVHSGAAISITLDDIDNARAIGTECQRHDVTLDVVIEVNSDDHRNGVDPLSSYLLDLAHTIQVTPGLSLKGVMTHAGESYRQRSPADIEQIAEVERTAVVNAAARLRADGHECRLVSVGSTPTATFAKHLHGVTELRTGVYMFNDLSQVGLDVCDLSDIAVTVLTSVIHKKMSLNPVARRCRCSCSVERSKYLEAADRPLLWNSDRFQ